MLKTAGVSGSMVSGSGWSDRIVTSFYRDYIRSGYIHVGDTNMRSQGCQALGLSWRILRAAAFVMLPRSILAPALSTAWRGSRRREFASSIRKDGEPSLFIRG